jgi:hypothetical protein
VNHTNSTPYRLESAAHPSKTYADAVITKRNTRNNLFGTPLAPSVGRPYFVAGTYGLAAIRCWYVAMSDVKLASVVVHKVFCKFLLEPTPLVQHQRNPLDYTTNQLNSTTGIPFQLRRESISGAKMKGLWLGLVGWLWRMRRGILHYSRLWIGAPRSKDMNTSHGRRSELTTIIRNNSPPGKGFNSHWAMSTTVKHVRRNTLLMAV